jgi:hypothetical protein
MIPRACSILFILSLVLPSLSFAGDTTFLRLSPKVVENRLEQLNVVAEQRPAALKKAFQEAGCPAAQIAEQTVPGNPLTTVMCRIPGSESGTIVVGAALDYRSSGEELAVDTATLELLPLLVQSLGKGNHRLSMMFVGFAGEKKQEGSKYFLSQLSNEQRKNIRGMIFLDHLGRSFLRYMHPSQWNEPGVSHLQGRDRGDLGNLDDNASHDPTPLNKWLDDASKAMKLNYPRELKEFYVTHAISFEHKGIDALTLTSPAYVLLEHQRAQLGVLKMPATTLMVPTYYESYSLICLYLMKLDANLKGK